MAYSRYKTAAFGAASGGLATVGYELVNANGSTAAARATAGVAEVGTSTGTYGATVSFPNAFTGSIVWDTGTGSPKYAVEEVNPGGAEYLDAAVSTRSSHAAADVWDVTMSGHTTAGTTGAQLDSAGLAGDPLLAAVPASYAPGTAGYKIGTYLDVATSSVRPGGSGSVSVDHNYGITDAFRYLAAGSIPVPDATVKAYLTSDYAAGRTGSAYVKGVTTTGADGRWLSALWLAPAAYTLVFDRTNDYGPNTATVTVS